MQKNLEMQHKISAKTLNYVVIIKICFWCLDVCKKYRIKKGDYVRHLVLNKAKQVKQNATTKLAVASTVDRENCYSWWLDCHWKEWCLQSLCYLPLSFNRFLKLQSNDYLFNKKAKTKQELCIVKSEKCAQ